MNIDHLLESLLHNIRRPIIFYISSDKMQEFFKKDMSLLKRIGITDTLVVLDRNNNPKVIDNGFEAMVILNKTESIKHNTFKLLNCKSELNKAALNYLLNEYMSTLETFISLTQYVKNNAANETQNYMAEIQGYLDLQYNVLQKHRSEVEKLIEDWNITPKENSEKLEDKTQLLTSNKRKTSKKTEKQPFVTVDDADRFLLKTIFNVDV